MFGPAPKVTLVPHPRRLAKLIRNTAGDGAPYRADIATERSPLIPVVTIAKDFATFEEAEDAADLWLVKYEAADLKTRAELLGLPDYYPFQQGD